MNYNSVVCGVNCKASEFNWGRRRRRRRRQEKETA